MSLKQDLVADNLSWIGNHLSDALIWFDSQGIATSPCRRKVERGLSSRRTAKAVRALLRFRKEHGADAPWV